MKKLLTAALISALTAPCANAGLNCCATAPCAAIIGVTFDSSCTNSNICNCKTSSTTSNGVTTTVNSSLKTYCNATNTIAYASCTLGTSTYKCASGYYGTATSVSSGCTKCPANATCAGGNGSTFKCNANYYKSGTTCQPCPNSGKSAAGTTDKTGCYLPSGTEFADSTGSGTYTSNCYYSN